MEIETRTVDEVKVVKLSGRVTLGVAVDRLRDTIEDMLASGSNRLVLDLGEVTMIDSSGIGLVVRMHTNAKQQGGAIKLLNPSQFATKTFRMIGILNLFEVFDTQDLAVASFQ